MKKANLLIGSAVFVAILLILLKGFIGTFWYFFAAAEVIMIILLVLGKKRTAPPEEGGSGADDSGESRPPEEKVPPPRTYYPAELPRNSYIRVQEMKNGEVTREEMRTWSDGPDKVILIVSDNTNFVIELQDQQAKILARTAENNDEYIDLTSNCPYSIFHNGNIRLVLTWIPA